MDALSPPNFAQRKAASGSAARGGIDSYVLAIEPVAPSMPCAAVYDRFVSDPDLLAVPICVDGRYVGMGAALGLLRAQPVGIGTTQDEIERALKPFGQVASSRARDHDGTGLGLPRVTALCELNDIGFRIASKPDRGTCATLDFSKVELPPAQTAAAMLAAT